MPVAKPDPEYAHKLVTGAEKIVAAVPYCWLLIRTEEGVRSRPMGHISARPGEDAWTIRFLTDLRSQKVADIRRCHRVTLAFQKEDDGAYVSLEGVVRLIETKEGVRALWNDKAYGRHFPTDDDRANAGFIEVEVARIELWVRGLTPEPFGVRTTTVRRDAGGRWLCAT